MKKRITALILSLALTLSLCTCGVSAYGETVKNGDITGDGVLSEGELLEEYYLGSNSEEEVSAQSDNAYDHSHDADFVKAIEGRQTTVNVTGWGIPATENDIKAFISYIKNIYPQTFIINSHFSYSSSSDGYVTKFGFTYDYTEDECTKLNNAIDDAKAELDKQIDTTAMSNLEIALVVHDYLAATVAYDVTNLNAHTLPNTVYNMYGVLVNHSAVCQGYAQTFQYFMNCYGVTCGIASSTTANHAWNVIQLKENGNWYHLDATWDDPDSSWDLYGRVNHNYFLLSSASLEADDEAKIDFVVQIPYNATWSNATDTTYESGQFWTGVSARTYYHDGLWYYIGSNDSYEGILYSYQLSDGTKTKLKADGLTDVWYVWGSSTSCYTTSQSKMYGNGNLIYYSTPKAVYVYNIKNDNSHVYYTPDTTDGYVYGFSCVDGKMGYTLETGPNNISGDETVNSITGTNAPDNVHVWDTGKVTTDPTCTAAGVKTFTCLVCEKEKTEDIAAVAHTLTKVEAKAATCTEPGNSEYWQCSVCSKCFADSTGANEVDVTGNSIVVNATGHTLKHTEAVAATEEAEGNIEYWYCETCGKYFSDKDCTTEITKAETVIAVLSHTHTLTHVEKVDATCTKAGNIEYWKCDSCGKYFSDAEGETVITASEITINVKAHTPVTDPAVAATCTKIGLTEGSHCSVCNTVIKAQETVPMIAHTVVTDEAVAATCTTTGLTAGTHCSVCKEVLTEQEVVPALGHSYSMKWSEWTKVDDNNWTVPCSVVCIHCGDVQQLSLDTTYEDSADGKTRTYTASLEYNGQTFTSTKTVTKTCTVTLNGEEAKYTYGDTVSLSVGTASDWYLGAISDGNLVRTGSTTYKFTIISDVVINTEASTAAARPVVTLTAPARIDRGDGKSRMEYTVNWTVPKGYTFVEAGLYRAYGVESDAALADLTTKNVFGLKVANGTYKYSINMGTASTKKSIGAIGYLTYKDNTTGETTTIYTPMLWTAGGN